MCELFMVGKCVKILSQHSHKFTTETVTTKINLTVCRFCKSESLIVTTHIKKIRLITLDVKEIKNKGLQLISPSVILPLMSIFVS